MFVRTVDQLAGTDKEGKWQDGDLWLRAARLVTKSDLVGFSLADVRLSAGWEIDCHYKHHIEASFIISGSATLTEYATGKSWDVGPGDLYVVGPKDKHHVSTKTEMRAVTVFNPALIGNEKPDEDGAYPPTGEVPPAWAGDSGRTMFLKRLADTREVSVSHGAAKAYRYLTQADECGFTISTPRSPAGDGIVLHYKNHVEANYVIEGEGTAEDLTTGEKWDLFPGSMYFVGPRDRHQVNTTTGFYLLSIFNPPLVGNETHDDQGGYPPTGPIPEAWIPRYA